MVSIFCTCVLFTVIETSNSLHPLFLFSSFLLSPISYCCLPLLFVVTSKPKKPETNTRDRSCTLSACVNFRFCLHFRFSSVPPLPVRIFVELAPFSSRALRITTFVPIFAHQKTPGLNPARSVAPVVRSQLSCIPLLLISYVSFAL